MSRFFIDENNIFDNKIEIYDQDFQHITKVLRLRVDDEIVLCNGNSTDYIAKIEKFNKNFLLAKIIDKKHNNAELLMDVVLYQGIPKHDKMELIVQKSVELGIKKIVPIITERTIIKTKQQNDINNKILRWKKIAMEAAKQSGRGIIPTIEYPIDFENCLISANNSELIIMPYENQKNIYLKDVVKENIKNHISIIIGPEGGFADFEVEKAISNGANIVSLGNRILRTETAALFVLSALIYEKER